MQPRTNAYSDDEDNLNNNNNNPRKEGETRSVLPKPNLDTSRAKDAVTLWDMFCWLFALGAMIFSLYSTSLLILFLSGNAYGVLQGSVVYHDMDLPKLVLIDLLLLLLFVLQHAVMATERYKMFTSKIIPLHLHRSIYIIFTGFAVRILTKYWVNSVTDLKMVIWDWSSYDKLVTALQILHMFAWIHTFAVVFMLDFAEFMGLKQVYYKAYSFGCPLKAKTEECQRLFKHFRHATASGLMVIFWVVPVLSLDRLVLATVLTVYLFSTRIDERDHLYVQKMYKLKKVALKFHQSP